MKDDDLTPMMTGRARRSGGGRFLATLLGIVIGAASIGALAWHGELDRYVFSRLRGTPPVALATSASPASPAPVARQADTLAEMTSLEGRMAMLEDRFSRLGFEADAASGNAARAEGLLIAFAARRLVDRGAPLGYVADQLRVRFADAQPLAVERITTFARNPVTLDQLGARLEALSPNLTDNGEELGFWERTRRELSGLFVVRRDSSALLAPTARIDRARLMLASGQIASAIDEVQRLPGADQADKWVADARRYQEAQDALDLIETTAMLEPRRLKDGAGQAVRQDSPLAAPEPEPTPEETGG